MPENLTDPREHNSVITGERCTCLDDHDKEAEMNVQLRAIAASGAEVQEIRTEAGLLLGYIILIERGSYFRAVRRI